MTIDRRAAIAGVAAITVSGAAKALAQGVPPGPPAAVHPLNIISVEFLEQEAAKVLAPGPFAFIAGGVGADWTLHQNRTAYEHFVLEPHYLSGQGVGADTSVTILGSKLPAPIITAPVGGQGLFHQSADIGTAQGTKAAGTLMTASTASTATLEQIAEAAGEKWFQLYLPADRGEAAALLQRAKAAGYTAVCFTLDSQGAGNAEALQLTGFQSQQALQAAQNRVTAGARYADVKRGPSKRPLDWADFDFIMKASGLPVILKGVLSPGLAKEGLKRGAAGIQVSNHGGRQYDGVRASIDALPPIVDAVQGKVPIILDGGVRRGNDVFKALALGANCVAIGRPAMYGLALGGWQGVQSVHEKLRAELSMAMQAMGVQRIADINRSYVSRA